MGVISCKMCTLPTRKIEDYRQNHTTISKKLRHKASFTKASTSSYKDTACHSSKEVTSDKPCAKSHRYHLAKLRSDAGINKITRPCV
mmetsp:Transcript_12795/g.26977  ORF Transcript_12795/g.26977 Transcript_12795/m.26977 type:complete len:87 (-) Transcript_12795:2187-2447(-)